MDTDHSAVIYTGGGHSGYSGNDIARYCVADNRWTLDTPPRFPPFLEGTNAGIFGWSYGGYAALSGVTGTPDLYACGISYVGVSNLFTWFAAIPPYWKPYLEMMYEMVGHPETDAQRLRETSPLFNVDRIRVPLLVAQGASVHAGQALIILRPEQA